MRWCNFLFLKWKLSYLIVNYILGDDIFGKVDAPKLKFKWVVSELLYIFILRIIIKRIIKSEKRTFLYEKYLYYHRIILKW